MTNPNRGRGGVRVNGRGSTPGTSQPNGNGMTRYAHASSTDDQDSDSPRGWSSDHQTQYRGPPAPPRGGFIGRGFRGLRGGLRGRGYPATPPLAS